MIKLDVADYCHKCPYFEAATSKNNVHADGICEQLGDTVISCENSEICRRLAGELAPKPSEMKDVPNWIYSNPNANTHIDFSKIEEALGFKLFIWQKYYILTGEYRHSGLTTSEVIRTLIEEGGAPIDFTRPAASYQEKFYRNELIKMKKKLNSAGIKTREIVYGRQYGIDPEGELKKGEPYGKSAQPNTSN